MTRVKNPGITEVSVLQTGNTKSHKLAQKYGFKLLRIQVGLFSDFFGDFLRLRDRGSTRDRSAGGGLHVDFNVCLEFALV